MLGHEAGFSGERYVQVESEVGHTRVTIAGSWKFRIWPWDKLIPFSFPVKIAFIIKNITEQLQLINRNVSIGAKVNGDRVDLFRQYFFHIVHVFKVCYRIPVCMWCLSWTFLKKIYQGTIILFFFLLEFSGFFHIPTEIPTYLTWNFWESLCWE